LPEKKKDFNPKVKENISQTIPGMKWHEILSCRAKRAEDIVLKKYIIAYEEDDSDLGKFSKSKMRLITMMY
jgi:hypothetical protein